MQNNDKNNKMPKRRFDWMFIIIIILAIVGIFLLIRSMANTSSTEKLNYTTLMQYITDKNIKEITAVPVGGENYLMYKVTGTFVDGSNNTKNFVAIITYGNLEKIMTVDTVKVTLETLTSNTWLSILLSIIPYILVGIILFWMFRSIMKSQGGAGGAFEFAKSTAKKSASKVTFADVAACDEEKEEL
ncbi:MAG: ATP-dependent metallopeptidase FtsH/Yme1/Tma family protein, partial [Acholeplasmatales bacterium]|nr:ATP-dependent metallopeptidase FtsH/Yme1/Tma family protein [Acholeplasmatales bacterium]